MLAILHSLGMFLIDLFKSRRRLEAENLFLRHQLSIALRRSPPRLQFSGCDRALLVWMTLSPPKTQIRAYRWCSPPRIGCAIMSPNRSTGRVQGASLGRGRSNANAVDGAARVAAAR